MVGVQQRELAKERVGRIAPISAMSARPLPRAEETWGPLISGIRHALIGQGKEAGCLAKSHSLGLSVAICEIGANP